MPACKTHHPSTHLLFKRFFNVEQGSRKELYALILLNVFPFIKYISLDRFMDIFNHANWNKDDQHHWEV